MSGFPGKFESTSLSRDPLGRETCHTLPYAARALPNVARRARPARSRSPGSSTSAGDLAAGRGRTCRAVAVTCNL